MKLEFTGTYKSLTSFSISGMPSLVVLTGKNGSGKSQLLELLNFKDPYYDPKRNANIQVDPAAGQLKIEDFQVKKIKLTKFGPTPQSSFGVANKALVEQKYITLTNHLASIQKGKPSSVDPHINVIMGRIAKIYGKQVHELTNTEIRTYEFEASDFELSDIFKANINELIINYFEIFWDNINKCTANKYFNQKFPCLEEAEFHNKYKNPFDEINIILESSKLAYRLQKIELQQYKDSGQFKPRFIRMDTNQEVDPMNFSSGEQVLLSLAFSILNASKYKVTSLPNLFLLDELDASLHPSMIRNLLSVLQKYFIEDKNTRVILTTHNPTTVALSPAESIYVMRSAVEGGDRISKADKREAIRELLSGVKSIDVIPENRRQVFVESKTDVEFYEALLSLISFPDKEDVHLNFISSGISGDGGRDLVYTTVKNLRNSGNDKIFGVVDWDAENKESFEGLIVSGLNEFYSLESIVMNPLFLGLFLIDETIKKLSDFGLNSGSHWTTIVSTGSIDDLTAIIKNVESDLSKKIQLTASASIQTLGGASLPFDSGVSKYKNGHDYFGICQEIYPQLKKYRSEQELMRAVTRKVITYCPQLMPRSVTRIFEKLLE